MNLLYNVEDSARLLSISKYTVRAYIRKGILRPVRIGRRVLLEQTELQRLIEEARARVLLSTPDKTVQTGHSAQSGGR